MHHRPLALVSVLAGGDYLLWNWSLQGSHDVLALISGLTLTPLAIALLWLLALNAARVLGWIAQRPRTSRAGTGVATAAADAPGAEIEDRKPGGERTSSSKLAA